MATNVLPAGAKVSIIGCGYMGTALLQALLKDEQLDLSYTAHVRTMKSSERLKSEIKSPRRPVEITYGNERLADAIKGSSIVLLGCLPGEYAGIFEVSGVVEALREATIVSMLAGVSTQSLKAGLSAADKSGSGKGFKVVRIIPTLGCNVNQSVTLVAGHPEGHDQSDYFQQVTHMLETVGSIHKIPESLMDEATAIGAAMHALAICAVDSAVDASVAEGVPRDLALALTASCLKSAGSLMQAGMSPEQMKAAMSTPKGITINALVKLDESVKSGIARTVREAVQYTKAMSG